MVRTTHNSITFFMLAFLLFSSIFPLLLLNNFAHLFQDPIIDSFVMFLFVAFVLYGAAHFYVFTHFFQLVHLFVDYFVQRISCSFNSIKLIAIHFFSLFLNQDIEHGASPDGPSNAVPTVPKKCEKALLARIWGNFDKK